MHLVESAPDRLRYPWLGFYNQLRKLLTSKALQSLEGTAPILKRGVKSFPWLMYQKVNELLVHWKAFPQKRRLCVPSRAGADFDHPIREKRLVVGQLILRG
ncbi:hypothetical protein QTL95_24560 [Rhizobium sp. S152]|uniref:hypothetical protein n=1 Tax=Rhizobium sp. S152 TaxID=3055038 RepID=UPI0025A9DEB7|nr:hypothetical protein [Rhizobium sp. S152]MDM9629066.1 hypothetical protein [Rhizobium sp. S152]